MVAADTESAGTPERRSPASPASGASPLPARAARHCAGRARAAASTDGPEPLQRRGLQLYPLYPRPIQGAEGRSEGVPRFVPEVWLNTLWDNHEGNNGVLYRVLARVCHDLWSAATGAVDGEFREWPLRLPALIPGLASIFLLGLIGARVGGRTTGWLTALLAAVHPWHIRYCTEGRPYGFCQQAAPIPGQGSL